MATESATIRAAARAVSLVAFYAATRALDRPKIRKKARRIDRQIEKLQGLAENKKEKAARNVGNNKAYVVAGVATLAVAGALIIRVATS